MPEVPKREEVTITRHQWTIGSDDQPTDAKNFRYGLHAIYTALKEIEEINLENDDAFFVVGGDGGQVIIYVDVETQPGLTSHREGWCRPGDRVTGPWKLALGATETQECRTCGRTVGK